MILIPIGFITLATISMISFIVDPESFDSPICDNEYN